MKKIIALITLIQATHADFDFLKLNPNTKSSSLGGTGTALIEGVNFINNNPATLGKTLSSQFYFMYSKHFSV
jgi:hypothetical protein